MKNEINIGLKVFFFFFPFTLLNTRENNPLHWIQCDHKGFGWIGITWVTQEVGTCTRRAPISVILFILHADMCYRVGKNSKKKVGEWESVGVWKEKCAYLIDKKRESMLWMQTFCRLSRRNCVDYISLSFCFESPTLRRNSHPVSNWILKGWNPTRMSCHDFPIRIMVTMTTNSTSSWSLSFHWCVSSHCMCLYIHLHITLLLKFDIF